MVADVDADSAGDDSCDVGWLDGAVGIVAYERVDRAATRARDFRKGAWRRWIGAGEAMMCDNESLGVELAGTLPVVKTSRGILGGGCG